MSAVQQDLANGGIDGTRYVTVLEFEFTARINKRRLSSIHSSNSFPLLATHRLGLVTPIAWFPSRSSSCGWLDRAAKTRAAITAEMNIMGIPSETMTIAL